MTFTWTDERIALLRKLWSENLTATQIAAEFGNGVTRSSILGKANRIGLYRAMEDRKLGPAAREAKQRAAEKLKLDCPLLKLTPRQCRWPFGDPHEPSFHFCGAQSAREGVPYCPTHMQMAYQPSAASPRRFERSALFFADHGGKQSAA
jgi:GcrA cell cycle regulator